MAKSSKAAVTSDAPAPPVVSQPTAQDDLPTPPVTLQQITQEGYPVPSGWAFNPRSVSPLAPVASKQPNKTPEDTDGNTEHDDAGK